MAGKKLTLADVKIQKLTDAGETVFTILGDLTGGFVAVTFKDVAS